MDFQVGMIVLIVFVSLFAIWLIFYFIPVGLWFLAQGPALDHRFVDDRKHEGRTGAQSQ